MFLKEPFLVVMVYFRFLAMVSCSTADVPLVLLMLVLCVIRSGCFVVVAGKGCRVSYEGFEGRNPNSSTPNRKMVQNVVACLSLTSRYVCFELF